MRYKPRIAYEAVSSDKCMSQGARLTIEIPKLESATMKRDITPIATVPR
jgi:hypothetical protein